MINKIYNKEWLGAVLVKYDKFKSFDPLSLRFENYSLTDHFSDNSYLLLF